MFLFCRIFLGGREQKYLGTSSWQNKLKHNGTQECQTISVASPKVPPPHCKLPDVLLLQPVDVVVVFRDYALLRGVVDGVWSAELASSIAVVDVAAVVGGARGGGRGVGWGL